MENAQYLFEEIAKLDRFSVNSEQLFFNEFIVESDIPADTISKNLEQNEILSFLETESGRYLVCATEKCSKSEIDNFVRILGGIE